MTNHRPCAGPRSRSLATAPCGRRASRAAPLPSASYTTSGDTTKHRFQRSDGAPIWFAGLWDHCVATDVGAFDSFTILTAPSSGALSDYHDRAPLCLEPEDWAAWLSKDLPPREVLTNIRPERFEVRS